MTNLDDALVNLVRSRPGASYAEFQRLLSEEGFQTQGDYSSETPGNLILWVGMSDELEAAIRDCMRAKRIHWHPLGGREAVLVYLADGALPRLPIAKRPPKGGYKEPHWLPIVWHPGSHCSAKNCCGKPQPAERTTS